MSYHFLPYAQEQMYLRRLEEAEQLDRAEDQQYGSDRRGDELPEALRTKEGRLQRVQEAKRRLEAEVRQGRTTPRRAV